MSADVPGNKDSNDGRELWHWESRYPPRARQEIRTEAILLASLLILTLAVSGVFLGLYSQSAELPLFGLAFWVRFQWLAIFFSGCVGGLTFSIKWLIHSVAKGKWHQDRRYWRYLVPLLGGVYACAVISLWNLGLVPLQADIGAALDREHGYPVLTAGPLAFLIGYFSDAVGGMLTNVANAIFGTVKRK